VRKQESKWVTQWRLTLLPAGVWLPLQMARAATTGSGSAMRLYFARVFCATIPASSKAAHVERSAVASFAKGLLTKRQCPRNRKPMKTAPSLQWTLALCFSFAVFLGFGGASAHAGTYVNDFNSDPAADPNFSIRPSAKWVPTGSYNGSGYISLADAIINQQGTVVLPDFDSGSTVIGFTFKAKVRIGGGTSRPADGLSVSFADAADGSVAGGTVGEEGTAPGLSVNLDTWDNGNGDGPAMDVKVDGVIVAHKRFAGIGSLGPLCAPVEQDGAGNPISLETDPAGTSAPGTWVDFEMSLNSCGALTVTYKGGGGFQGCGDGLSAAGRPLCDRGADGGCHGQSLDR
jgi:Bacterial lectin